MTGSDKADGYSDASFAGLSEREKEIVFDLLSTELPWSIRWLFVLDAEKAAVVAREKEIELRGQHGTDVYLLQQQLVNSTGDLRYQSHMIEDYQQYRANVRPLVVDAIGRTPTNQGQIDFFKKILLDEVSVSALARAARHLLDAVNFPKATDADRANYNRLITSLRSDSRDSREVALAEISTYASAFFDTGRHSS